MTKLEPQQILELYRERLQTLNAHFYSSLPTEDSLLIKWWLTLSESGDLEKLITPQSRSLRQFLNLFSLPTTLIYALSPSNNEIIAASWLTPADNCATYRNAYCGFYTHPAHRLTKFNLTFTATTFSLAFEFYDFILGTTWQPKLLPIHTKLGYDIIGCVPKLYDEEFVYIVRLTKERFLQSRLMTTFSKGVKK